MSGLVKAKVYNYKDSNVANIGSDKDKALRKTTAGFEPAWKGMEENVGLKIWRIEKFEVKDWPKEKYGRFYSGDSYIILYSEEREVSAQGQDRSHHVHFWIGQNSTEDEYGTAAYKTVELDDFLNGHAIQHRECQKMESEEFKEYFGGRIVVDDGGIETGFKHVEVDAQLNFKDTVVHFKKVKNEQKGTEEYQVEKKPFVNANFTSSDYVVVFSGKHILQIKPKGQPPIDSFRPFLNYWREQKELNPKAVFKIYENVEEFQNDKETYHIYKKAPSDKDIKLVRVSTDKNTAKNPFSDVPRKTDASAHTPLQDMSEDVFIMQTHQGLLVFIGSRASPKEKQMAMNYATEYGGRNCSCSIRRECQGAITASWKKFFLALKDFHVRIPDEGKH
ncbi:gelsolin-like protein 2 [Acropora muricata]|uniref:gelsolin-like protein 2 n=1 Tax=Acropora muricata TaxID=159855 RepID=UPI0034E5ACE8